MIIYYTKYALTTGISKHTAEETNVTGMLGDTENSYIYFHKGEWFENFSDAVKKANEMKAKKIKALNKKLKKLENMNF